MFYNNFLKFDFGHFQTFWIKGLLMDKVKVLRGINKNRTVTYKQSKRHTDKACQRLAAGQ
jgi:hypothetical protein